MVLNIAIWTDPGLFGVYGNDLRNTWSNPFINTFVKIGGTVQDGPAGVAGLRDRRRHRAGRRRPLLRRRAARQDRRFAGRGGRRDRRGRHRLSPVARTGAGPSGAARLPPLRRAACHGTVDARRGRRRRSTASSATSSSHAMQRVPELAGRDLTLRPAVGRHHQPQLPGGRRRSGRPHGAVRHPPRRQRHPPARDQPRGGARGDGRRRGRRGGGRGARVPAPRGLPGHAVHRGHADGGPRRPPARRDRAGRRLASAASTRARRSRACSSRSACARRTGRSPRRAACRCRRSTGSPRRSAAGSSSR